MRHPIPRAALDDRLGFIGTSGSGKTYNAGTAVEILLSGTARVVIIDPLGVWWGLRLLADGKAQSRFDVAIFGGPHGDLPLTEHAGALIGETAATMAESCIIDLKGLKSRAAERRFMVAFLDALYRKAPGEPFHLVVDEADLFAPQKPQKGDEVLLGHMENIVRRGRVMGFIPWLISQRPAVLNKNVLSQVDGLLAFKLTGSQDRDALDAWIEGQADKAQGKAIKNSLPALQIGEGVVWIPGRGILDAPAKFPAKVTFDSSRTPKRGEKKRKAHSLKPLNLSALKDKLATVEAEQKADDPRALRSEVAGLKAERDKLKKTLDAGVAVKSQVVDKEIIKRAEERGFEQAKKKFAPLRAALEIAMKFIIEINAKDFFKAGGEAIDKEAVEKAITDATQHVTKLIESHLERRDKEFGKLRDEAKRVVARLKALMEQDVAIKIDVRHNEPFTFSAVKGKALPQRPLQAGDGTYSVPQMRVLRSLAMWRALGHEQPSREMVAAVAGYSPSSGGYNNLLGGLGTMGTIGKPSQGRVSLLVDVEVMTQMEGIELFLSSLSNPQKKIIATLVGRGSRSREDVATDTGYSASSGGFNNLIGSLGTLGIVVKPQQGHIELSDWAQELLGDYAERLTA